MTVYKLSKVFCFCIAALSLVWANFTYSAESDMHQVVIQVSTDDKRTQRIAINNAVNLQKHYGMDEIDIEIVAYGPGLTMLTGKDKQAKRISSLVKQNIRFSACANTMQGMQRKTGKQPVLVEGVKVVPAGVSRIIELQKKGYAYIRP